MSVAEAPDVSNQAAAPQPLAQGLYERHYTRIFGFCLRRLGNREEAEDAVQTTFLNALRALQRGVRPVSETAWLFKIAENVCLATHRSNGRRREREVADPDASEDCAGEPDLGREERRELLRALGTISENQRQALLLREWRGLSYREISAHLGVSVGAVETLIFRARKSMARALSERGVRRRVGRIVDLGALGNALKAALGSGAGAAKVAAVAAVVTLATLPAGDSARSATGAEARPSPASHARAAQLETAGKVQAAPRARSNRKPSKSRAVRARGSIGHRAAAKTPVAHGSQESPPDAPSSGTGRQPAPAVAASQPPAVPTVSVPSLPSVPTLPSVPSVRSLPELPEVPEVPQLPSVPQLPVELADPSLPSTPVAP